MWQVRLVGHLLVAVFVVLVVSDALGPLGSLVEFMLVVKTACAHFSLAVVVGFLEGAGLPQPGRKILI